MIMPLTYRDRSRKQEAVSDAAQLASGISDDGTRRMALAGILAFSDKIISDSEAERIRRGIMLTKIEKIIEREKQEAIEEAVKKNTEQVTERVTYNLILDLVTSGNLDREEGMRRVGLSDEEFGKKLEEYRKEHPTLATAQ